MSGFDFKNTEAAKNGTFLQPGQYTLSINGSRYIKPTDNKPDGSPKTPYVEVTFTGEQGQMTEKFFITPKAIDRLQYLHLAWFGKKCEKVFDNADEVGMYFEKVMAMKPEIKHGVIVGGTKNPDGKVYTNLGYSGFVLPDEMDFEEGPFQPNSVQYINNVRVAKAAPAVANTDDVMVSSNNSGNTTPDYADDLPF